MTKLTKISLSLALCSNLLYANDTDKVEQELKQQATQMKEDIQAKKSTASKKDKNISEQSNAQYKEKKKEWDEKESGFTIDAGAWFISWDQTSTGANLITNKSDGLDVKYTINDSVAAVATLRTNYKLISGSLQYYTTKATAKDNEEISGLNLGFVAMNFIPNLSTEFRMVKADFKGHIEATERSNGTIAAESPSSGTFETQLNIWDFIVYPFNDYVGFGYRKYRYDFPQDMYVMRNSDNLGISRGLLNVEYDGSFVTLAVDNKRLIDKKTKYNGIVYSITAGVGELEPKAAGFEEWIETSDAKFVDLLLAYSYKHKSKSGIGAGFDIGYRYNKIETTANKHSGTHSLLTEFITEFHGPFVNLVLSY